MPELDLSKVEEVEVPQEVGLPFPLPPVETLIKQAAINVTKGRDQNGNQMVLLQFITPVMLYSVTLDENASNVLSDELRPSSLVTATALDLPKG